MEEIKHLTHYNKIANSVSELNLLLERTRYIHQELTDEYFNKRDIQTDKKNQFAIIHDYRRYGVFADVVHDYLFEMEKEISSLYKEVISFRDKVQKWQNSHYQKT